MKFNNREEIKFLSTDRVTIDKSVTEKTNSLLRRLEIWLIKSINNSTQVFVPVQYISAFVSIKYSVFKWVGEVQSH